MADVRQHYPHPIEKDLWFIGSGDFHRSTREVNQVSHMSVHASR